MENEKTKISLRQAMLLFIVSFLAPAIRYIPIFTTEEAKQAAWLSPFITVIFEAFYMYMFIKLFKKYKKESFIEILNDVFGKVIGFIICVLYFLWLTLMIAYNLRIFAERILGTVNPNMNIILVIIILIFLVIYVVKNGIVTLARMNELFIIAIVCVFALVNILMIPNMEIKNIFPITYKDIYPVFKANFGILAIWSYSIAIFLFADKIKEKTDFKNVSIKLILYITIISVLVIITPIAIFGQSLVTKMPVPFFSSVMQISIFETIERIESMVVIFWIVTDFILISVLTYASLHIITKLFKLKDTNPFIKIYMLIILFFTLCIAKSNFELSAISVAILTPLNIIMGYCIPVLTFAIAKVRGKV